MEKENKYLRLLLTSLVKEAKNFSEYQSIGNGAKLNCCIRDAEIYLIQLKKVTK